MGLLIGSVGIGLASSLIMNYIRLIFFSFDAIVYWACGGLYEAAMKMVDINDFMETSSILSKFADLIYSFLAIFMFFKVAFSLLTMIIDPTQIEDKQKGASKLIQNIFICLTLIVAVPAIFNGAREIQNTIIKDQIIENAIYGEGFENDDRYTNVGHKLAIASWSIFIHPSDTFNKEAAAKKEWEEAFNIDTASQSWEVFGDLIPKLNNKSLLGVYHIEYLWGLSTIFGFYLLWTFIKLAIDIAYRSLKLFILQLISPIAIISFIDPKSGKDGIFAKWAKECIKTYISLFVRIFVYALAGVVLVEVTKKMNANVDTLDAEAIIFAGYQKFIYLIAIIAFIKSGPKIFDNILGTEISKDSETKFATDMVRSLAGAGAGMAIGGISGAVVAKNTQNDIKRGAWEGIKKGAASGYAAGKKGGFDGMVGVVKTGMEGQKASADYFGVKAGDDARKLERQRAGASAASDHVEDLKNASGFKNAVDSGEPTAIQNAAQNSRTWAQRKFNLNPNNSNDAKILQKMDGLAEATAIHQSDTPLMKERAKVFDDISKNQALVTEGKITQDEANILNEASITKYNKLAAQKDVERLTEETNNAANYATQLQTMSRQQLEIKIKDEISSLYAKPHRTTEEESRFNQLYSQLDTTTGKVKSSVSNDEMIEHISHYKAKSAQLNGARSKAGAANANYDKKSNAVGEFKNSNTAGAEYYKAIEMGDKIRGR